MIDLVRIRDDIMAGLPAETNRLKDARINADFDELRFELYPTRHPDEQRPRPPERNSPFLNRVLNCLTMHLYADAPTRTVEGDKAATDWLKSIYDQEGVDTRMHQADRLALREDVCAIRVVGRRQLDDDGRPLEGVDPDRPILIDLWAGHEFAVWCSGERPLEPLACCTIDRFDERTRYRLYTRKTIATFQTARATGKTSGGIVATMVGKPEVNPYGVLPFVFVHWAPPVSHFWHRGPGTFWRKGNDVINHRLTRLGDTVEEVTNPRGLAINVEPDWLPPSNWGPGRFVSVPGVALDVASPVAAGQLDYLHPPVDGPSVGWEDEKEYVRHILSYSGIPESIVEAVVSEAASGEAILRDQAPLIAWAKQRLPMFRDKERELAALALLVGACHGVISAPARPSIQVDFPSLDLAPPPAERDRADQFDIDQRFASPLQVVQRRMNMDRDAALKHMKQVADDRKELEAMGLIQAPPQLPAPGAGGKDPNQGPPSGDPDQGRGDDQ